MSAESTAIQQAAAEFIRDRHLLGAFLDGLLRDVHVAEDVLQEVWLRLSAEVEQGTHIENQPAWCRGVARNLIRQHWEKQQTARVVAGSEALAAFMERVEQFVRHEGAIRAFVRALQPSLTDAYDVRRQRELHSRTNRALVIGQPRRPRLRRAHPRASAASIAGVEGNGGVEQMRPQS